MVTKRQLKLIDFVI